ncbi:trypsin-like serine protease, partial [Myxococcota bacterium]|nr:trypsin-like serine protease [Myxococcota bacterium]
EAVDNDWIGRWVEASGYGNTYSNDTGRFFAKVQVYDYDTSIVSVDGHGEQGICYGDSGGPIIWQATPESDPVVVGTEQWGDPSCVDQDHLTRLDYVANFVDATIAAAPAPTLVQCTGDISRAGECDGDVARWCGDAGYERSIDCGATDQKCGYRGSNLGYDCLPSSCGEIDFGGECQDNEMLAWCGSYGLIYTDCDSYHLSCIPRVGDIPGFECGGSTQCGGVETDLATSLLHCGDCDTACAPAHANGECNDGECSIKSCKDDYADTDKDIENGCEVDEGCAAFPTTTWAALLGFAVLLRRFRKRER